MVCVDRASRSPGCWPPEQDKAEADEQRRMLGNGTEKPLEGDKMILKELAGKEGNKA